MNFSVIIQWFPDINMLDFSEKKDSRMSAKSKDKTAVENKEPVKVLTFPHSFTSV